MCTVSMIFDYGRKIWPYPNDPNYPWVPGTPPYAPPYVPPPPFNPLIKPTQPKPRPLPTHKQWEKLKKLLEVAREFDDETDQHDCEDPEKLDWFEAMERRMEALEAEVFDDDDQD